MKEDIYFSFLEANNTDQVIDHFYETIIDTNRSYSFFVDWEKVKNNVDQFKVEFNILNSLIGSKAFNDELKVILKRYPEVLPVIPILIAIRDKQFKISRDFLDDRQCLVEYDFSKRSLSSEELDTFIEFFENTGLRAFFESLSSKSIQDYVTGVEVGMDTHARKNRSGNAMELAIKPLIDQIVSKHGNEFTVWFQKKFKRLKKLGIPVPTPLQDRKADFIIVKNRQKVINIEVNFYSGTGSKPQEIVDSYINRQMELQKHGLSFVWVTDGNGWRGQKNQIKKGFLEVDYLLNLHLSKKGLLEKILCQI